MNPADPDQLDAALCELLQSERDRPDVPDTMHERILRGVELKLRLGGGTGSGGHGPSSSNGASGPSGGVGAAGGSALGTGSTGLAGLLGGLLLAACLGVRNDARPLDVFTDPVPAVEVVASAGKHDVEKLRDETAAVRLIPGQLAKAPGQSRLDQRSPVREIETTVSSLPASSSHPGPRPADLDRVSPFADEGSDADQPVGAPARAIEIDNPVMTTKDRPQKQPSPPARGLIDAWAPKASILRLEPKRPAVLPAISRKSGRPSGTLHPNSAVDLAPRTPLLVSLGGVEQSSTTSAAQGQIALNTGLGAPASNSPPAASSLAIWSQSFGTFGSEDVGGGANANSSGRSVAVDSEGNTLVTGSFTATIDLGNGPIESKGDSDIFLVKLDPTGHVLWSKVFGGRGPDHAVGVAVNCDFQIVVTGGFTHEIDFGDGPLQSAGGKDAFLAVLSPSGDCLWSRRFGDENDQLGNAVKFDGGNNIVVTGAFNGTIDLGGGALESAGGNDVFVAELDSDGKPLWSRRFGGDGDQAGSAVAVDSGDNVIVTGAFDGALDFDGVTLVSAGGKDVFVTKLDSSGATAWTRRFGDDAEQSGLAIAAGPEGEIVVTGEVEGAIDLGGGPLASKGGKDIFLVELSAGGASLWGNVFGDAGNQSGLGVAVDSKGNVVLTGGFEGSVGFGGVPLVSHGLSDAFVVKLDVSGKHLWSKSFGDSDAQTGRAVAVDANGEVLFTGGFAGILSLGATPLKSLGDQNIFVARLSP